MATGQRSTLADNDGRSPHRSDSVTSVGGTSASLEFQEDDSLLDSGDPGDPTPGEEWPELRRRR